MGLNNFILTCEKDNEELRKDINYYKNMTSGLKKENQELKKQLEENTDYYCKASNIKRERAKRIIELKTQQKEFIKYLKDMLDDENDIFSVVRVKDVLQKYKEIIGEDINGIN